MTRRKLWAVWLLLMDGDAWNFCVEKTLAEALLTARTLLGGDPGPLFARYRVWIAHVDQPAHVTVGRYHRAVRS